MLSQDNHTSGVVRSHAPRWGRAPRVADSVSWSALAACQGEPSLFIVPEVRRSAKALAAYSEVARAYCRQCPVFDQCQTYATEARESGDFLSGQILAGRLYQGQHARRVIDLLAAPVPAQRRAS